MGRHDEAIRGKHPLTRHFFDFTYVVLLQLTGLDPQKCVDVHRRSPARTHPLGDEPLCDSEAVDDPTPNEQKLPINGRQARYGGETLRLNADLLRVLFDKLRPTGKV